MFYTFRYNNPAAHHLYICDVLTGPGKREYWAIEAANRTAAARHCLRFGALVVASVNMEG